MAAATRVPSLMRRLFALPSLVLCVVPFAATAQPDPLPPSIGTIEFYGLRTIPAERVRALLPFTEGDDFPVRLSREAVQAELADALDVARVELNAICCTTEGLFQFYVGVEETPASRREYRETPTGTVRLPDEVMQSFETFLERSMESVLSGEAREDRSQGHALADSPRVREIQQHFLAYAESYHDRLVDALHASADARHRAAAAHVLGYAADKAATAGELARAVLDPDAEVRNYATRSLAVIAGYANDNPDLGIEIRADPLVDMLNSMDWSDRNKGLGLLVSLTEPGDPALLARLEQRALPALIEMCGWRHWGHASPACLILQRILGLPDADDPSVRASTIARARALQGRR